MSSPSTCHGITAGVYVIAVLPEGDALHQPEDGVVLIVQSIFTLTYAPCMNVYNMSAFQGIQAWYALIRPSGDIVNDHALCMGKYIL